MTDRIFGDGLYFEKPRDGAPDFVKGKLGVNVAQFRAFMDEHEDGEWLNFDLLAKKDKDGFYFTLDTYNKSE